MNITTVGIDLAKDVITVYAQDAHGRCVVRGQVCAAMNAVAHNWHACRERPKSFKPNMLLALGTALKNGRKGEGQSRQRKKKRQGCAGERTDNRQEETRPEQISDGAVATHEYSFWCVHDGL